MVSAAGKSISPRKMTRPTAPLPGFGACFVEPCSIYKKQIKPNMCRQFLGDLSLVPPFLSDILKNAVGFQESGDWPKAAIAGPQNCRRVYAGQCEGVLRLVGPQARLYSALSSDIGTLLCRGRCRHVAK